MYKILEALLLGLFALTLVSCGGGSDGGSSSTAPVTSVSVKPSALTLVLGQTQQLTAQPRDAAGRPLAGRAVTWNSSEPTVATVSESGLITAVAEGLVTISATSESIVGSAAASVRSIPSLTYVSVAAGGAHTCALTVTGTAYCWGRGESGQLGVAASSSCRLDNVHLPCELFAVAVGGGLRFTQITAGGAHTCALTADGIAHCWGDNARGQVGDNSTVQRNEPVAVATTLRFISLDAGASHTCGLTSGGIAHCWGRNDRGQLGDGTAVDRLVPTPVTGGRTFATLTAGGFEIGHSCALDTGGAAYCWGDNGRGQLGLGVSDVTPYPAPAAVSPGMTFSALSAGLGRHTCGLANAGAAYCWGENTYGALGDGTRTDRASPALASGSLTFTHVVAGGFLGHTCALSAGGTGYCWGENERGQVGDGTTTDRLSPHAVAGGLAFDQLDAGFRHTCGLTTVGVLYCWGSGAAGQLGINSTEQSDEPAKVLGQP